jgi:hypothetical protein
MTANRLLLAAIAALAFAGAAHALETDSHVDGMGEQGFRRFEAVTRWPQRKSSHHFHKSEHPATTGGFNVAWGCLIAQFEVRS